MSKILSALVAGLFAASIFAADAPAAPNTTDAQATAPAKVEGKKMAKKHHKHIKKEKAAETTEAAPTK